MNNQIFDQIEFNVTTLEFTLYINVLGIQEQFSITHSKAQYLIESVNISDKYKIDVEASYSHIYYIVTLDKDKETTRQLKALNKTLKQG